MLFRQHMNNPEMKKHVLVSIPLHPRVNCQLNIFNNKREPTVFSK